MGKYTLPRTTGILVSSFAISAAVLLVASSSSIAATSSTTPDTGGGSTTSSSVQIPHPVELPTAPVASATDCPNPPELSSPLPVGATLSAPSLTPSGTTESVGGVTKSAASTCEYTLTMPATGVNPQYTIRYVNYGNSYLALNTVTPVAATNYYDGICYTNVEIFNGWGDAFAGQELTSGYCNTYSNGPLGTAMAVNTNLKSAFSVSEGSFHTWFWSYVPGGIFYGYFSECLEVPVGNPHAFVCSIGNYGPLL